MPPPYVKKTFRDYILYYYAKLVIAPSAGESNNYKFIMSSYKKLKSGELKMSNYDKEIQQLVEQEGKCIFCEKECKTKVVELIPHSLGGPVGMQNLVHACPECAESKGNKELIHWWCNVMNRDKDDIPRIVAGLFLKMAYQRHTVEFSLDKYCDNILDIWPQ